MFKPKQVINEEPEPEQDFDEQEEEQQEVQEIKRAVGRPPKAQASQIPQIPTRTRVVNQLPTQEVKSAVIDEEKVTFITIEDALAEILDFVRRNSP